MSKKHTKYINTLAKLASSMEKVGAARVYSCVVYKNSIQSFGMNQMKSHPFQVKFSRNKQSIYLHAEIAAIYNALKVMSLSDLQKSTLYVCRVKMIGDKNQLGLSKPCEGCARAIATFGIKNVVYSNELEGYSSL